MIPRLAPVHEAPFPIATAISDRVGKALEVALRRHSETASELQLAIEACVRALREQGMSPEGALITIKALVKHSAASRDPNRRQSTFLTADYFMDDIVHWCVVEYFRRD
jgi:hypothetical protein